MDKSRLPAALLVALGLAPEGCTKTGTDPGVHACLKVEVHPCLSKPIDRPPVDDGKGEPPVDACLKVMPPKDPPVGACLDVAPEDPPVTPCLKVLGPTRPKEPKDGKADEPRVGPCLKVAPPREDPAVHACLEVAEPEPNGAAGGGMARTSVVERLLAGGVLAPDVAARLLSRRKPRA